MLSVILYGRYDDHGYNYHKRLAISLNCLAEILSDSEDEIIFVDYNTSDELPTIVEAIQDTLSAKAKDIIRILRVRPSQHKLFPQAALPLIEPVARNIGIRRSSPNNKWILSTNVDMVFVPALREDSLTQIVARLSDGYYCLPRFELPENLWEVSFERSNPARNLAFLRENSQKLHLDTVVRKEGFLKYDNPGDFQLMLRKDIFEMGGFDENMLKGWHVDSNLAKRMHLFGKTGGSLEPFLKGYHCNHTFKHSFLHSQDRTQNDWFQFVDSPTITPILPKKNWGLPDEKIEEIQIRELSAYTDALISVLKDGSEKNYELFIHLKNYNTLTYSPHRVFTL